MKTSSNSKYFQKLGNVKAVDGVTLISKKGIFLIIRTSGCGKTTLLRLTLICATIWGAVD